VSEAATFIGGGFDSNKSYPLEIYGALQDGAPFDFITYVTI
jgi:hypothetical protein